ncbi:hypothetical protein V8G61_01085 [Gaetbulibacter sp. M240]|uniref:hypothetical protein n=1 Tax=Gaetbulibacter sp. M240 TaxID=3126511 RepID=UPI00374E4883
MKALKSNKMEKIDLDSVKKFEIEELEERLEMTTSKGDGEWSTEDTNNDGRDETIQYSWDW